MINIELESLEQQIDKFVDSFQKLSTENNSLRKQVAQLNLERAASLDKEKRISGSLKKIITQLQDELSCKIQ
jgi:uncharacterized protein (TIGR02449 family)